MLLLIILQICKTCSDVSDFVSRVRYKNKLSRLKPNTDLDQIANQVCELVSAFKDLKRANKKNLKRLLDEAKLNYYEIGQIVIKIKKDTDPSKMIEKFDKSWGSNRKNSDVIKSHNFTEVGTGMHINNNGDAYLAAVFAYLRNF